MPLPNEVLDEIFTYANEETVFRLQPRFAAVESNLPIPNSMSESRVPSFAQVCTQWRTAALSCSWLWNSITVTWPTRKPETIPLSSAIKNKEEMCALWFKRSGKRPLSIHFSLEDSDSLSFRNEIRATRTMIHTISPHLDRLRHFHILCHLPTFANSEAFRVIEPNKLPLLETLSLEDISESCSEGWCFQNSFIGCRNLRRLVVEHDTFLIKQAKPLFPWDQLTYLDSTTKLVPLEALEIIEACPRLEHAGLFLRFTYSNAARFVTSHLRSITVSGASISAIVFLQSLLLPKVETFHLDVINEGVEGDENNPALCILVNLFTRSNAPLTSLSLHGQRRYCEDSDFFTLFSPLIHLTKLSFRDIGTCLVGCKDKLKLPWFRRDTLGRIAAGDILPGLTHLRLECPALLTETILVDLVKSRRSRWPRGNERVGLEYLFVVMNEPLGAATRKALEGEFLVTPGRVDYAYEIVKRCI